MADDDKGGKGGGAGGDDNEAAWAQLDERVKKNTRAAMDEWWEERQSEAKKAGLGLEVSLGPLGRLLGLEPKVTASTAKKD